MNLQLPLLCAALLMAGSASATTANFTVTGTITPPACTIGLSNGGAVNLGQIDLATLSAAAENPRPAQNVDVSIVCSAAAKIATSVTDDRAGTASAPDNANFGLSNTSAGNAIGYYKVFAENGVADSAPATVIGSTDATSWISPAGGVPVEHGNAKYTSVGDTATGPATATTVGWTLRIEPTIASASSMAITRVETINGQMTLTLVYL